MTKPIGPNPDCTNDGQCSYGGLCAVCDLDFSRFPAEGPADWEITYDWNRSFTEYQNSLKGKSHATQ